MPKKQVIVFGKPNYIRKDLTGKRFGKLVAMEVVGRRNGALAWLCKCDCGNEKIAASGKLIEGGCTHCGCMYVNPAQTHGMTKNPLYKVWQGMKIRCLYPSAISYPNYGGRGIKVCEEWLNNFMCFYNDMKDGYKKGLQLDRIDNDKDYSKENCCWSTRKVQTRNKRNNRWYEAGGLNMIIMDWASYLGIGYGLIVQALDRGHLFIDIYNHYITNPPKKSRIKKSI